MVLANRYVLTRGVCGRLSLPQDAKDRVKPITIGDMYSNACFLSYDISGLHCVMRSR